MKAITEAMTTRTMTTTTVKAKKKENTVIEIKVEKRATRIAMTEQKDNERGIFASRKTNFMKSNSKKTYQMKKQQH